MEFYLRQFFIYGKILVPTHEHHLIALFHIICLAIGLIAGFTLLFQKDESTSLSGAVMALFSIFATMGTIYAIS